MRSILETLGAVWRRWSVQTRTAPAVDATDPAMLILVSGPPTREAFLAAFWQWVANLAEREPARASAALWWTSPPRDPEALARQILRRTTTCP